MEVKNDAVEMPNLQPPDTNGASGLVLFISNLIEDPTNYNANGKITINRTMIELIRILIRTEKEQQEADKNRDEPMNKMASQIRTILQPSTNKPITNRTPT